MATVFRTNLTNAVLYTDTSASGLAMRFYRTPTNQFNTAFLTPTGPHPVGRFSRLLTDASRTNRFGIRTNSSFMATVWYPAQAWSVWTLSPYSDRLLAQRQAYWGSYSVRVPALYSHGSVEAPVADKPNVLPVIIYSHGLGDQQGRGVRTENTAMVEELASQGYVVVAIDHTDTYGTVFPPESLVLGRNVWSFDFLNDRLKDVAFLLNLVERWNIDDPLFQGRLDMEHLGIMGWSFGGGTAAEACRTDARLKAAVLLDGYLGSAPTLLNTGLATPFISMNSGALLSENTTLFNKSATNAYLLSIRGASHEAFTDNSWMVTPSAASRQRALAMHACLVSFFNRYLRGADDRLLENPGAQHPDVVAFKKK
ncbi:MAG: hypothetical protein U1G07_12600 [Verrucomicrobiota bacterium]